MYPLYLSITRSSPPLVSSCISHCLSSELSSYALVTLFILTLIFTKSLWHLPLSDILSWKWRPPFLFLFTSTQFMALTLTDTSWTGIHSINPPYSKTLATLVGIISPPMYKFGHCIPFTSLLGQPFLSLFLQLLPKHLQSDDPFHQHPTHCST
jgi:hypothetical protein